MPLLTKREEESPSSRPPELYCPQCRKKVPAKSEKCPECGGEVKVRPISSKFMVELVIGMVVTMVVVMMALKAMQN